ncbi:S-DNA-T family DNA segregation ATPase FtsK/SpoIIIE [Bradyrhizobium japonicum]|uniref:DNA translocase FtsK n=1 Tax=Bradyrhizobium TaxID=374 RepID=UPI000428F958|nr:MULTISPECIES: DNA translocase FtsK [Bradyrhizobium]MBR0880334.1 DNA translocase FtsK 4TM domain-containing protein [Bradyrhizobium liaoningense]MBR0942157.1 DNA translocase FtsK 4TM domain-containing protein [Bradyrhizobium liaoningense]MBR1000349.1 DNA translocase FtsK 4TM domain-containing protein [Bradyrhizobium liaoningense]MBR1026220.1 DNA translocase FtsK 4TM domain-containing protein [Bradyrhizobium liaoningense]MBR1068642.1 DNA translocase FtsK 4TM domain-containing protein [Bradyrh
MSMSAIERVIPLVGHLPPSIREGLARRMRELTGFGLIALSGVASAALMTWSVQDPSLSHATSRPIRNILGYAGAIGADLAMQILGLGAIMLVLTVAVWGWRMMTHRPFDREALRLGSWILCTVIAAGFVSCWPHGGAWPLPTGLGGVVGDALVRAPAVIFGPAGTIYRMVLGTILFAAMGVTFLIACGLGAREHDDELAEIEDDDKPLEEDEESDRGSVSLGWLFHALMSTKARLIWLLGTAYRSLVSSGPKTKAVAFSRQEPNLGGGRAAPSISPQSEDEIDEDEHEEEEDEEEEEEEEEPAARAPRKKAAPKAASKKSSDKFELPSVSVLAAPKAGDRQPLSKAELEANSRALEGVLQDFGVRGEIVKANPGPVVTLYELEPAPGIKSSRVIGLSDDIARSMSALSARVAVVPGRNAIGIELPNAHREKVYLRELLIAKEATDTVAKLPLCLGKTIGGDPVIIDLARTPHMLIAGTTGSGKSVAINTMILSLVYRLRPDQCRLIMVDPKMLELSVYDGIPHLLTPVVTDPKKAVVALKWAVREMEERYKNMAKLGVRNIDGYNTRLLELKAKGEEPTRTVHTGFDKETGKAIYEEEKLSLDPLPYIVIIVDEMADLMMVAGKDIEGAVQRLAQMARAAGLHVILATQRPSVDVITGTIKANFPTRIAFQVTSKIDSRTILGEMGAEQLLGQGDMLYMAGGGRISRVHGPFASDEEVEKVVRHLKTQGQPEYLEAVTAEEPTEDEDGGAVFDASGMGADGGGDLFQQAVAIVKRDRKASTSYIQRRLQIGYNRAASLMERMELEGIVGPANHAGKREILVEEEDSHM